MEEDLSVRAILIGVGVLIAIATITVIIAYYSSAKEVAQEIGTGANYDVRYRQDIETTLIKTVISGQELINMINYFKDNRLVHIDINNMKVVNSVVTVNANNINNTLKDNLSVFYSIRPEYAFKMDKSDNDIDPDSNLQIFRITLTGVDLGV